MSGKGPDSLVDKALEIALRAHRGWLDKGGQPYILHPLRLMAQMSTDNERLVAILHDVLEDGDVTASDLRQAGMPEQVVAAVELLTRPKGNHDYQEYVAALKPDPLTRRVKMADLEDNLDLRRLDALDPAAVKRTEKYLKAWRFLASE